MVTAARRCVPKAALDHAINLTDLAHAIPEGQGINKHDIVMIVNLDNMVKRVSTDVHRRVIHVNTSIIVIPAIKGILRYLVKDLVLMVARETIAIRKPDHVYHANMDIPENIATTLAPNPVDHVTNSVNVSNANLDIQTHKDSVHVEQIFAWI
ncbi:hypothetical protein MAR_031362 [Mya arenaria]|uniref:Uncharacterized protein n=1 Tax=Mya arenaria TaxID=6604 RepID=A0ABY7F3L1_MYAAR|nr:hypothetical protein MAR_031362 [Mya arenaria]